MGVILQKTLPFAPWMQAHTTKLPGIQPIKLKEWLQVDEVYTELIQLRNKNRALEGRIKQLENQNFDMTQSNFAKNIDKPPIN